MINLPHIRRRVFRRFVRTALVILLTLVELLVPFYPVIPIIAQEVPLSASESTPSAQTPTPSPSPTVSPTPSPSSVIDDSLAPEATESAAATQSATPATTPEATASALPSPTPSASDAPTASSTPEVSPTPQTSSPAASPTPSPIEQTEPIVNTSTDEGSVLGVGIGSYDIKLRYPFAGKYPISYRFGETSSFATVTRLQSLFGVDAHDGVDFAMPEGTPILAADTGTVQFAGTGDYGLTLVIAHSWGTSYYGHLSQTMVTAGDAVTAGQTVALSGATGFVTAPHLHFGIKPVVTSAGNGFKGMIDPLPYLTGESPRQPHNRHHKKKKLSTFRLGKNTIAPADSTLTITLTRALGSDATVELTTPAGQTQDVTNMVLPSTFGPLSSAFSVPVDTLPLEKPGQYTLTMIDAAGTYDQQSFAWGVLALNTDKSLYLVGDTAQIDMAVLDETGMMVCDAQVDLTIQGPQESVTLSTQDESIQINSACTTHGYTVEPDYETQYSLSQLGTYTLTLTATTENGQYTIQDEVSVVPALPFNIQRKSATRIYPPEKYPVTLTIQANQDFNGMIQERIPADFEVSNVQLNSVSTLSNSFDNIATDPPPTQYTIIKSGDEQTISWNAHLVKGQTYTLSYTYDAPDVSPEFDTIGPLVFFASSTLNPADLYPVYSENRSWQIAFDALGMGVATRLSSIGFELQSTTAGVEFTSVVGSPAIDTTTYRSGAASLEVAVSGSAATEAMTYNYATANSADDYYLRAYIYITTLPSAQAEIMTFRDSTPSTQASIRMNTDGTLEVWNDEDSVQVGSDSLALSTGRWYRIEFRVDATTIGSTVLDGRIDGVSFASGTVNHANGSLTYTLGWVTTSVTGEINFDDVALNNDSVTDLNWPGEGRIVHMHPNADGTNTCSSGSVYTSINEVPPDDATSSVLCDVANDEVGVNLDSSATAGIPSSANINIMQVGYRFLGIDASTTTSVHGRLTVGGAVEAGTAVVSSVVAYTTNHNSFQNYQANYFDWTPATSTRRVTPSDLDSAIATFRVADATPDVRVTNLWLLVEFSVPDGGRAFSSGFELQSAATGVEWTTATGSLDIDTTTKHAGSASLRVQSLGSGTEESLSQTYAYANGDGPYFSRSYVYITTPPSAENRVMEMKNTGGTTIAYLTIDNSRTLKLYDEDGQITGTTTVPSSTWTRLEMKVDATGSGSTDTVEGRMDGNIFATSASRNLSTGTAAVVVGGNLNGEAQTTGDWYFDDVAVNLKGAGTYQTDYPGEGKITHLRPNATGDSGSWAVSVNCAAVDYTCMDEVTPDDGTTAVGTTTARQIEDVNVDSATTGGISYYDTIKVVAVSARTANSSTTQSDVRLRLKAAASTPSVESESIITNSTTYATGRTGLAGTYPLTVYNKPNVNTPWTAADLDSAQIGIRNQLDSASNLIVSTLWMLVEYETPSGGRLYSSGFELNSSTAGIEWSNTSGSPTVQGTTVKSGTYGAQINSLSSGTAKYFGQRFNYANTNGAYYLRTYLRVATAPSAENRIIAITDTAGTSRAYLTLDNSRQLKLYDEDSSIGSVSSALTLDTWYRVELKIDTTAAGGSHVVEAKIDGASAFATASNRNVSTGVAQIRIGGNLNSEAQTTGNWYFDDIALNNNAGSSQNSYPGEGSIVHLHPNADGDTVAWTNSYTNIDEVTPNDGTDVISSTTQDQLEEANLEATSTPGIGSTNTINLVSVGLRFRSDSLTHFSSARVRLKDAASATQVIQSEPVMTASNVWHTNTQEEALGAPEPLPYPLTSYKRPDGTNNWTPTVLDSSQIGVQLAYDLNSNSVEVSTLWLLVEYAPPVTISIAGTADGNSGATVKVAVNSSVQAQTTTISGGNWTISGVTQPSLNDIVTVWVDAATGDNETTGVTKYSTGNVSGMVLNNSTLTIGSNQDTSLTISNLDTYDCSSNEDIVHQAGSSHLKVEGDSCNGGGSNSYTSEKLEILSGDTLTVATSETVTTYDLTISGTLTSSGNSTYNVAHNWAKTGTFTSSTSTVNLTGSGGTTQTLSGTTSFNNLTATGSSARTIKFPSSVTTTVTGTLTLSGASSQLLTLDPGTATTVWTINPTAASVSYVSVSYSTNSGVSFCATNSTDGTNNSGWLITSGATCNSTASSFQRKTWYDGTRYWRSSQDMTNGRIIFEYSSDGSSWTEDTSARIATNTNDVSVWADSSNAYVAYKTDAVTDTDNLVNDSNLVAYWKMNETSWNGTTGEVVDSNGNSLNGTRVNNATTTSSGKFGYGGTFDGTDDYVNVPDPGTSSPLDITSTVSISAWIYPTSLPGTNTWQSIITKGSVDDTNDQTYQFLIGNSAGTEVLTFCMSDGSLHCNNTSGMDLVANTWQHVGMTYTYSSTSSLKVYHNGTEYTGGTWDSTPSGGAPTVTNKALWIGADDYDDNNVTPQEEFNGRIDDLRLYNDIVTLPEFQALANPGYDIEVRKASSYPGTGFSWSNPTVGLNGSSSTVLYQYPNVTQDSAGKIWLSGTLRSGSNYDIYAVRSTSANVITAWDTSSSLDTSTNSNKYAVIVPRTSSAAYSIWMDGTAIEGKNYNGTSWDGSPTAIDTGVTGITKSFSAVADGSGNVYLAYVEDLATDQISHTKWNGTSWTTPVLVADAGSANDAYPSLSYDTAGTDLYAFWIDTSSGYIYYSTCDISTNCDDAAEWDAETLWKNSGTNTYVTSNYSGSTKVFAEWTQGAGINWDKLTISVTVNLSGVVYTNEGTSNIGANKTVNLRIDGAGSYTDETDASGVWALTSLPVSSGQVVTVYLDNETEEGTTVMISDGSTQTNVNIYQNTVIVRADTGSIIPDNLYSGDDADDDVKYAVSAGTNGNVTIDSGFELHVWTGDTFDASGGTVTTQGSSNIHVDDGATLTLDTATNTIAGDLVVDDTAVANLNQSTTINGGDIAVTSGGDIASTAGTVTMGASGTIGGGSTGSTFQLTSLTVSSGTTTLGADADNILVFNGDINVSTGATLAMNGKTADVNGGNVTTTSTGSITCSGCSSGGITLSGDGGTNGLGGGSGTITIYALTLDGSTNTTTIGTSSVTVLDDVTIGSNRTLTGNSGGTLYVADDWSNSGTFTPNSSTVNLNGGGGTTQTLAGTTTFYTLTATGSSARTIQFPSSLTTTITNALTLTGASSQLLTLDPGTAATTWTIHPPASNVSIDYATVNYSSATECITATHSSGSNTSLWDFAGTGCTGYTIEVDHEEGNFSDWTSTATDGGDLSVTAGAALGGTSYGMSALIDDTNVIYGVKDIGGTSTTGVARARLYVDPNSLTLADLEQVSILYLLQSDAATNFANIKIIKISGGYYLRGTMVDDNGVHQETAAFSISDAPHYIEIKVTRATSASANNATYETWLDGVAQTTMTGVDSYTRFADFRYAVMGGLGFGGNPSGTIYLDELVANDTGAAIGAVASNTAPDNPSSLAQKTTGDVTISTGDWVSTTSIKFTATASDTDASDTLYLCVEKDILGTSFSNTEDSCGSGVAYSGSAVSVSVTIASQTDASEYHWQARIKDAAGAYSSWVAYGGNAESARDYGLDTTAPTGGTVYDGTSTGVDTNYSDSSLTALSANWGSFNANASGLNKYQYSIGTTAGATDVKAWTDNGTTASVTATGLTLQTSQLYYVNVRAVDNAGNTGSTVSSNGQIVAPSISFSVSPASVTFNNLSAANSYTDTNVTTLTTSTNAYNGYVIRAFIVDYLRSPNSTYTIGDFSGGTYASPATWSGSETGYGYTSSDTTIQGSNKFSSGTLYAPFSHTGPGDIIADHTSAVSGSAVTNEQFTITHKVKTTETQAATKYTTTVVYTATAQY